MEVDITCDGYEETCVVLENGYILMSYLDLYPKPFSIFYEKNGKLYPTKKEENKFKAVDGISKYKVVFTPTSTSKSSLTEQHQIKFSDIMSNIHDFSENSNDKNKPKIRPKIGKKKTAEKPRLINVAWLNRDGEDLPFEKMGKKKDMKIRELKEVLKDVKNLNIKEKTMEEHTKKKRKDSTLDEPIVDLKKPKIIPTINLSSKKLSETNNFEISKNKFVHKSSHETDDSPSKTDNEIKSSQSSIENAFGKTISSTYTRFPDPFKRPIGKPIPRKCSIELDNVHKLPLPFMTEIKNSHLTITEQYFGSGAFGTVKLGYHNRTEVAIKVIDILGTTSKTILKEIAILREINHENIVSIVGVCCQFSEFWIVMGLVKGHNLKGIIYKPNIKKLYGLLEEDKSFSILVNFSTQLLKGMTYIENHHLGITHRDVKPTNILISTEFKQLKICDMGLAKVKEFGSLLLTTQGKEITVGTRPYMAPEVLIKKEDGTFELASKFSDAWAVACTLIEMFQEKHIWDVGGTYDYTHPITFLRKKQEPLILEKVPNLVKNILIKGLNYDHKNRATCEQMFHEFLCL
ncbi:serine/threonine-protein kinase RAD53-like [Nasonia vitripennis]|uniref:Protein kinase domain-containing protein n=1 Tax=Nasonia vitripennis TaxID=7425 RepID=A0A7M7IUW8_NASVI|nr:serine/threonine-protein kinase RAD53-like [Nasonia vitripennis]